MELLKHFDKITLSVVNCPIRQQAVLLLLQDLEAQCLIATNKPLIQHVEDRQRFWQMINIRTVSKKHLKKPLPVSKPMAPSVPSTRLQRSRSD